jgi:hypothetical protein
MPRRIAFILQRSKGGSASPEDDGKKANRRRRKMNEAAEPDLVANVWLPMR